MMRSKVIARSASRPLPFIAGARAINFDIRSQYLCSLQEKYEAARDQFDVRTLAIPEWQQAEDALERAYDCWLARETAAAVEHQCAIAKRYIDAAIEMSSVSNYYDGRI
jgi:hypothetical protein